MLGSQMLAQRGSLRTRSKASDRATQRCAHQRNKQVAASTISALEGFEERLENAQFQDYEGLDEAGARPRSTSRLTRTRSEMRDYRELIAELNGTGVDGTGSGTHLDRSHSAGGLHCAGRRDLYAMKPPSPLTFYDYGCVSTKARSAHAQHRRHIGEQPRPDHRRTNHGFLFPGGHFERGTYGFSVVDPILLPPRSWSGEAAVPDRWRGDAADVRPLAAHELSTRRNRKDAPVTSPNVRTTKGHAARARLAFHHLDKRREEAVIEQARFENGMYEGRWRDPMLDLPPGVVPEASPAANHTWTKLPLAHMNPDQVMALRLLYNINSAMRHSRGRFSDLFAKENFGAPGVLELEEFQRGLLRLGVYHKDEVSTERLRRVISVIDLGFDGRVNLPAIQRAVVAVRNLQEEPPPMGASLEVMEQWGQHRGARPAEKPGDYGDGVPVSAVKLQHDQGIFQFRGTFEKFRSQQRDLLTHHGEL